MIYFHFTLLQYISKSQNTVKYSKLKIKQYSNECKPVSIRCGIL